ncbi:hypothetical protein [Labedaea rhizosphaerae]|uniref:Uncharacterized protein n=1 Tax=Labedaea rhizosphaerae TaxID=598644 RepID=A0A4R6SLC1_LABRH|nr:hypothetical protein [Labedaea rhizosphaerae]TDQ04899.1 hypothetical protein EV186_101860 [Labedaea rhizosphaerae]
MGFHIDYRGETKAAGINYVVTVKALSSEERLALYLAGATDDGKVLAEGELSMPPGGMTPVARLLKQALDAVTRLDSRGAAARPANAYQPWTAEQDEEVRAAWLAASPRSPATPLIRELAESLKRSPTAIRARLPHVGCDPDVPGRELGDSAGELLTRYRQPQPEEQPPATTS